VQTIHRFSTPSTVACAWRAAIGCVTLLAALLSSRGSAAAQGFPRDDFSAHRFYVAPGPRNFIMVDGGEVGPELAPTFGATLAYLHRPFAADDLDWLIGCEQGSIAPSMCADVPSPTTETDLVGPMLTLQLYGAITVLERVQIGLNLPLVLFAEGERYRYVEGTGRNLTTRTAAPGGVVGGFADPRISAKVRILDPGSDGNGVILGAGAFVTVPIGHYMWEQHFMGDRLPQLGLNAIAGVVFDDFRAAVNVGATIREEQTNIRSAVGPEMTWGLAAAYRFHPLFEALVEWTGATSFGQRFDSEAPMEIRVAGLAHLGEITINLGAGAGLVHGVGLPVGHVFGGAAYAPRPDPDTDGDGLADSLDGCPNEPEDDDEFEDEDGCPELDNDRDEIPDATDPCPNDAEDLDEHEDEDGCPEEDNDGDGIRDGYDSCPDAAEDMDGDRDTDGCPDQDRDGDGIDDGADQCPTEAEDFDGFGDHDGCPETDFDEDGIPDADDQCPAEAEDIDHFQDRDGCPEEGPVRRRR
jgi:hypothetical protein